MTGMPFDPMNPPQLPPEAFKPLGCDCTGARNMHTLECALFRMDPAARQQAVDDVEARVRAHTDWLNQTWQAYQEAHRG